MDEEYEDEEDRLIAQGGMGIPLDQVGPDELRDMRIREADKN